MKYLSPLCMSVRINFQFSRFDNKYSVYIYIYMSHKFTYRCIYIYIVQSTWVDYDFDCYESCVMDLWVCIHRWLVVVGSTFTTTFWSPSHHDSR